MFVRLARPQTDNVGVVKFVFFLGLNIAPVGLPPRKDILIHCGQWHDQQWHDDKRRNQRRHKPDKWQIESLSAGECFQSEDNRQCKNEADA